MDFEAYYDSSGQRGDRQATTLAGLAASKCVWEQFGPLWGNALDGSGVLDRRFGMSDLMACRGRFKDWDKTRKHRLLNALLNVLAKFRPAGLSAYSYTVFFDAYDAAKSQMPKLRKLEAICVNHCVGRLQLTAERPEAQTIDLYLFFDRNEPFLKAVDQVWRQLKKRSEDGPTRCKRSSLSTTHIAGYKSLISWPGKLIVIAVTPSREETLSQPRISHWQMI